MVRLLHERFRERCPALAHEPVHAGDRSGRCSRRQAAAAALAASPELATTVPDSEYEQLLDFADALGVEDYFWQEGGAAEESFIPAFDFTACSA